MIYAGGTTCASALWYARDAEYIHVLASYPGLQRGEGLGTRLIHVCVAAQCAYRCLWFVSACVEHAFLASVSTKHRPDGNFNTYHSRTIDCPGHDQKLAAA